MTDRRPTVTVLLPVFNSARYLREALDTVLQQTYTDLEVLVIEDGSTDASAAILGTLRDPRVRVIRHATNQGLIRSLNEGLSEARGRYIARMDADDRMHPERIARQVAHMDAHPELAALATRVEFINADGDVTGHWDTDQACVTEAAIAAMMPRTNCIAHPSVMLRAADFQRLRYDPRQSGAEDWDLWLRSMAAGLRIAKLPDVLLQYRVHAASIMAGSKRQEPLERRLLRTRWRFLRSQLLRGNFGLVQRAVAWAQVRTIARHLKVNVLPLLTRDVYRSLTTSPVALWREHRALNIALAAWQGDLLMLLPSPSTGGAERMLADVSAVLKDARPLILFTGDARDHGSLDEYRKHGITCELPRLARHPFTRTRLRRRLTEALEVRTQAAVLGSLSAFFFDLLPELPEQVRAYYIQHAFLYQPAGNKAFKAWLPRLGRVDRFIFVARQAMAEFDRFLFAHHVPRAQRARSIFIPNMVHRFHAPAEHDRVGVLWVGRDSPEKRLQLFLQLAETLSKRLPERFHFTLVGPVPERVPVNVRMHGLITDPQQLSDIYRAHDVLVLTSEREGFPLVVMEAMAHGLAVVSTPVGDIPGRLRADHAVLTESVDNEAVLEQMVAALTALANDPERLRRMRKDAFAEAQRSFAPEAFARAYRELLTSPRAAT